MTFNEYINQQNAQPLPAGTVEVSPNDKGVTVSRIDKLIIVTIKFPWKYEATYVAMNSRIKTSHQLYCQKTDGGIDYAKPSVFKLV